MIVAKFNSLPCYLYICVRLKGKREFEIHAEMTLAVKCYRLFLEENIDLQRGESEVEIELDFKL